MATNTKINGKEYYKITRTIGYKYKDGKRVPVKKQFYGTSKRNAESKYDSFLKSRAINSCDPSRLTGDLAEEFNEWFKESADYAESTKDNYIGAYKRDFKALGIENVPIGQLSHEHIEDGYKSLDKSEDALKALNKWMKAFIQYAEKRRYCSDIMKLVEMPRKEKIKKSDDIIVWEDDEIKLIMDKMRNHMYYPILVISLYAGLRIGEILGLKWSDVKADGIHIERQWERGRFQPPKKGSNRVVPIHPLIKEALDAHPRTSEYIFVTASGNMIDYANFNRSLTRAYKQYGIPNKPFHTYRRTFCTNLCRAKVPIQTAAKLMGHKDIKTTAQHYAKVKMDEMNDAILKLK